MIRIIPSLLQAIKQEFVKRYQTVSRFCRWAQLDALDGSFLPYRNFHDPKFINTFKPQLALEVHFMINNLEQQLSGWEYPWVKKIIFHLEAVREPLRLITAIKRLRRVKIGIALNPETPVAAVYPFVKVVDTVLVMTVHPGKNGALFQPQVLSKIRALRRRYPKLNIEVDGGINPGTARLCRAAGANLFVVGSYLKDAEFKQRYELLKKALQ